MTGSKHPAVQLPGELFIGTLILFTVLAINFIGDGLRDAPDPHSTRHV